MDTPQTPALRNDAQTSNEPAQRLSRLLVSSTVEGLAELAKDRATVDELRVNLPGLRNRAVLGGGGESVTRIIKTALTLYPQGDKTPAEWAAYFGFYAQALHDVPGPALAAAMARYVSEPNDGFMPKPDVLRRVALETPNDGAVAYERARKVLEIAEAADKRQWDGVKRHVEAPAFVRDPKELRDKVIAGYRADKEAAAAAKAADPDEAKYDFSKSQGVPAPGSHMTPQMRELLRRQRGEEMDFTDVDRGVSDDV